MKINVDKNAFLSKKANAKKKKEDEITGDVVVTNGTAITDMLVSFVTSKELNESLVTITENKDIDKYLCEAAIVIHKLGRRSRLHMGKIFHEVFEKLAGTNQHDGGEYSKWLESYGFSRMSALRYKKRWGLYESVTTSEAKELIEKMPDKNIQLIANNPEKEAILNQLDQDPNNFNLSIEGKKVEDPNDHVLIPVEFAEEYKTFTRKVKKIDLTKLKEKDREQIHKLIERFNKIIGE